MLNNLDHLKRDFKLLKIGSLNRDLLILFEIFFLANQILFLLFFYWVFGKMILIIKSRR